MAHFYLLGFPQGRPADDWHRVADAGRHRVRDIPGRHACTFSVWPSIAELARLVQGRSEAHGIIARRSDDEEWLAESLFARFVVIDHAGIWAGADPLD